MFSSVSKELLNDSSTGTSKCGADPGRDRVSISSGTSRKSLSSSLSVSPGSWLRVLRAPDDGREFSSEWLVPGRVLRSARPGTAP
eukprot:18786_3